MTISMSSEFTSTVLMNYYLTVEGLKTINENPLPREGSKDTLQIRCVIDGIPYRSSSAYLSSYVTEERYVRQVSGSFVANLSLSSIHTVSLQWKKLGSQMSVWRIALNDQDRTLGYSLSAMADHLNLWYREETTNVWRPLSEVVPFTMSTEKAVVFGYTVVVQPQLKGFLLDRLSEYVMTRIVIDGVPYQEGSDTFSTVTWAPSAGVLQGMTQLMMSGGKHTYQLQWRKVGELFDSWGSNPSFLDGFASSRNLYVLEPRMVSTSFDDHFQPSMILTDNGQWTTVNNNVLTFNLIKESAVLLTYSLPVTQHGNPNLDANVWNGLSSMRARLVVDRLPYTLYSSQVASTSRIATDATGERLIHINSDPPNTPYMDVSNRPMDQYQTLL